MRRLRKFRWQDSVTYEKTSVKNEIDITREKKQEKLKQLNTWQTEKNETKEKTGDIEVKCTMKEK